MTDSYLPFPNIDPVIFEIGSVALHWYGVMYLIGFVAAWGLAKRRLYRTGWNEEQLSDLLFYGFIGVILGGRLGYVFFYQFDLFLNDPSYLFKIWTGGMSFHGGLLGVIAALWFFAKKRAVGLLTVGDFVAPLVPIGLGMGRIGNFINAELWGRTTDVPWAFVFPNAGPLPRHPSQLYEFFLEGVVLFAILWLVSIKPRPTGLISGLFLMCYGAFRFIVEFFREPDAHIGLYGNYLSQGQLLSLPMIAIGLAIIVFAFGSSKPSASPSK